MTILQRLGQLNREIETNVKANEFVHFAKYLAAGRGDTLLSHKIAEERRAVPGVVAMLKAAVAAGSTTGTTWAGPLAEYSGAVQAFIDSLRSVGAFDTMLPHMRRVPLRTRVSVTTVGASAVTLGQGFVTPISSLQIDGKQIAENKAVSIIVVNDELARLAGSGAAALFGRELRAAVASETDREFISLITAGVSSVPTNGGTAIAIRQDIAGALEAIDSDAASQFFVLIESSTAKAWATKTTQTGEAAFPEMGPQGGMICGVPAVVTDGVGTGTFVMVDTNQIAAAAGAVEVDASNQAALQLETAPDSPPTASTAVVSLFQQGATALKALRYFGAERLRTNAVAVVSGLSYSGNSPA